MRKERVRINGRITIILPSGSFSIAMDSLVVTEAIELFDVIQTALRFEDVSESAKEEHAPEHLLQEDI